MSMSDPVSDMLTRIRNAQLSEKPSVGMPASKLKASIAKVLKDEGYIEDFAVREASGKPQLEISLSITPETVIEKIERVNGGAAHLQASRDIPQRDERAGHCDRIDLQGGHDRPQSARFGRRRRSSLHRRLEKA